MGMGTQAAVTAKTEQGNNSTTSINSTGSNASSCSSSPRASQTSAKFVHKHMIMRVDDERHGPHASEAGLGVSVRGGRVHSVRPGSPAGMKMNKLAVLVLFFFGA